MRYIYIFFLFSFITSLYCDTSQECSTCQNCWSSSNGLCSCSFYNAFCYDSALGYYTYNSSFLFKYDSEECQSDNVYNLCSEEDITDKINSKNYYTFFSFNSPVYLNNNNNLMCKYTFNNNNNYNSNFELVIKIEVKMVIEKVNNGRNLIFILIEENNAVGKSLYEINLNEFTNDRYSVKISDFKSVSMYLSLIGSNYFFNNNEINYIGLSAKISNTKTARSKTYKYIVGCIFGICLFCLLLCFILYIIKVKRNREVIRLRRVYGRNNLNNTNHNRVDPEEKRKKMEELFKEKLKKKEYLKKYNVNETTACSICLEEFIEKKSIVCITPCLHIFHYDCLHNWLFTENSSSLCPYCNYDLLSKVPPTKRHKTPDANNLPVKPDKTEDKKEKEKEIKNDPNVNSSEREFKKIKKNNTITNNNTNNNIINNNIINNNITNNTEENPNQNNSEGKVLTDNKNNKIEKGEDIDMSFEKDINNIKNFDKVINNIKSNTNKESKKDENININEKNDININNKDEK